MAPSQRSVDARTRPFAIALATIGLPVAASLVLAAGLAGIVAAAGSTLGYDYQAYIGAAQRLLDGRPLYDTTVDVAGGFAIYLYPPPFALAMVPFALLPATAGLWAWLGLLTATFVLAVAILPVRREVRWLVLLFAGLSWPFLYTMKLGQVTPLLFLALAAGWRWLDRPARLGISMAIGTATKLQPAVLFLWAAATRRWRAIWIGAGLVLALAVVSTALVGTAAWADYVALLRRVSSPIATPHNFTPGAIAYQAGADQPMASLVQWAWLGVVAVVTLFAWVRRDSETSYVVTVVASQAVSPLLWDHYAMILLIPVAFLLERRRWWAAAIPLVTWLPFAWLYPAVFMAALLGPLMGSAQPPSASSPIPSPEIAGT
jgi:hypothetical protein